MSNAKKCDRCGGYYDWEPQKNKVSFVALLGSYDNQLKHYDVCPDCASNIIKFMTDPDAGKTLDYTAVSKAYQILTHCNPNGDEVAIEEAIGYLGQALKD